MLRLQSNAGMLGRAVSAFREGLFLSTKLTVGVFTPSVLLSLARRLGRLEEYGIDADPVPVASSPAQFRALLAGELDVAFTSPDNVVAYRFCPDNPLGATADVTVVSAIDRGMGLGLYARPGLRADRLRGAVVAVDVPTSGFALAMYALTESLGIGRDEYELVAMGSTPKRLSALLVGECDATMLNAGNELLAEDAGCVRLAGVAEVCAPYLGTVLSITGTSDAGSARRLAAALRATAGDVCSGTVDDAAVAEARSVLGLPSELAHRYVERLKDPVDGLVVGTDVDLAAMETVVALRRRYLPQIVDGADLLAAALDPDSGLIATRPALP